MLEPLASHAKTLTRPAGQRGGRPVRDYKRAAFLDASAPVAMSLDLVLKDLRLITAFAQELGVPVDVTRASLALVAEACEAGFGPQDMAALSRALRPADPAEQPLFAATSRFEHSAVSLVCTSCERRRGLCTVPPNT